MKIEAFTKPTNNYFTTEEYVIGFGDTKIMNVDQFMNELINHEIVEIMDNSIELEYYNAVNEFFKTQDVLQLLETARRNDEYMFVQISEIA